MLINFPSVEIGQVTDVLDEYWIGAAKEGINQNLVQHRRSLGTRCTMAKKMKNAVESSHTINHILALEMTETHAHQSHHDIVSKALPATNDANGNGIEIHIPHLWLLIWRISIGRDRPRWSHVKHV